VSTVPATRIGKINFYEAHVPVWAADPPAIGLTAGQVDEIADRTAAAREAFTRAREQIDAARSAVRHYYDAVRRLHRGEGGGAEAIASVQLFAESTGDPKVYSRANIPPPRGPGRIGDPGKPYEFSVQLFQSGAIQLTWKCRNPRGARGTMYEVRRCDDPQGRGPFRPLGIVGVKQFTDPAPPATRGGVTYEVIAVRSTQRGPLARYLIHLGGGPSAAGGGAGQPVGSGAAAVTSAVAG